MAICYLCDKEIAANLLSREHIITQNLGGRLTSTQLLCKTCNSKIGELYDLQFAGFGDFFCNYYNVERSRSKNKKVVCIEDKTGHRYFLTPGEKTFNLTLADVIFEETENFISSETGDVERGKHEMERLKKNFPDYKFSFQSCEPRASIMEKSATVTFPLDYDRPLLLKSVCKMMANFHLLKGGEKKDIKKLIEFLKPTSQDINHFCLENLWPLDRKELLAKTCHILIIRYDSILRSTYGYFEIFGYVGYVTLLSGIGEYKGPDKIVTYAYDLINRQELSFTTDFRLTETEFQDVVWAIHEEPDWNTLEIGY